jgi:hypothetical protein
MKLTFFLFILLLSYEAFAVDYAAIKVSGLKLMHNDDYIRFAVDKDPNVFSRTVSFQQSSISALSSLFLAYTENYEIASLRSSDDGQIPSVRHYADALAIEVASITRD